MTDCGTQFTSELFKDLAKTLGTSLQTTTPYHQQANGQVERQNKTIAEMLSTTTEGKNWAEALPMVCFAYNSSVHSTTKQTPFSIVHSFDPKLPSDLLLQKTDDRQFDDMSIFVQEAATRIKEVWAQVSKNLEKEAEKMKRYADERKKAAESRFVEQQLVLLVKEGTKLGHSKFDEKFRGPYRILEIQRPNLLVRALDGDSAFLVHMDKAKPYFEPSPLPHHREDKLTEIENQRRQADESEKKRKKYRYADRNIEESDSESDSRPGKEWLDTISGGEEDSDDSPTRKVENSSAKTENPIPEYNHRKI